MTTNAFVGRTSPPTEADITAALGAAKPAWDLVVGDLARELELGAEWKSYGAKFGWALQLRRGKRNIVHLGPREGDFVVLLILGRRAVDAARAGRLGKRAEKLIDEAPRYPEGTGVRIDVKATRQVALVRKLARIKLEN